MENIPNEFASIGDRVKGQFPLSIATSLAVESAVGIHPDLPPPPDMPIKKYDELWVNLRTVFRNLVGSFPKGMVDSITIPELVWAMLDEMFVIPDALKFHLNEKAPKVVFYYSHYKRLPFHYPKAILRDSSEPTPKQAHYKNLLDATMAHLLENYSDKIKVFDLKLDGGSPTKTAIITHMAYDLLSAKEFLKLTLLESHTGKFKSSSQWYTKYYQGRDLAHIPFREDFIQVFGDLETFAPMERKLRAALLEIATRRKWSPVTTRSFIQSGIEELQDPRHKELMRSILV